MNILLSDLKWAEQKIDCGEILVTQNAKVAKVLTNLLGGANSNFAFPPQCFAKLCFVYNL